jgi:prophage antirepressor-like protein
MKVVYRTRILDDGDEVGVYILKDGHNFWFEADVVAGLVKHNYPNEICFTVRLESWKEWGEFDTGNIDAPLHWKPSTTLVSEVGFLRLLSRSKLSQSKVNEIERWLFDGVILALREADQYMVSKSYHNLFIAKDQEIIKLHDKIFELYDRSNL